MSCGWPWKLKKVWKRCPGAVCVSFEPEAEKQFAGALLLADDGTGIVAFRGTDAILVKWKEDLNMSFESPVLSQTKATAFLETAIARTDELFVCGYSNGGNQAMYSASTCDSILSGHLHDLLSSFYSTIDCPILHCPFFGFCPLIYPLGCGESKWQLALEKMKKRSFNIYNQAVLDAQSHG